MVVGGLVILRRAQAQGGGRGAASGVPVPRGVSGRRTANGATRIDQKFEPYPGIELRRRDVPRRRLPAFGWAAAVATVEVDLDTARCSVRDVIAVDDVGKVIHPILCEGQVEGGTLQAVGYATIEEIKLRDGRTSTTGSRRT
jgi:CO/xanthine dehydrogenase Mo-binding subunit